MEAYATPETINSKGKHWLEGISAFNTHKMVLNPSKIIGCAMALHRELRPGLREDTYQRTFANHLSEASLPFEAEQLYLVYDDPDQQRLVGYYTPDFVVDEKVIVEIKL